MTRPSHGGPGSNQHETKPPVAPRTATGAAASVAVAVDDDPFDDPGPPVDHLRNELLADVDRFDERMRNEMVSVGDQGHLDLLMASADRAVRETVDSRDDVIAQVVHLANTNGMPTHRAQRAAEEVFADGPPANGSQFVAGLRRHGVDDRVTERLADDGSMHGQVRRHREAYEEAESLLHRAREEADDQEAYARRLLRDVDDHRTTAQSLLDDAVARGMDRDEAGRLRIAVEDQTGEFADRVGNIRRAVEGMGDRADRVERRLRGHSRW